MTLVVTRTDVQEYMSHHAEYTKANRFKRGQVSGCLPQGIMILPWY